MCACPSALAGTTVRSPVEIGASMTAEHQCLDRKQQSLDTQKHRMNEADRVDRVQDEPPHRWRVLRRDDFVIAGIRIDDAGTAGRDVAKAAHLERLEEGQD